ncbi:MAG TPA: hypothetical protein VFM13_02315 [Gaiellaceae bacterium]|nr:hypothetical protein [Gaiellaceae bacterium]
MAKARQKDILNRLADAGEEAFSRVAGSQTTSRLVEGMTGLRERMDDVQRKIRGLDALERRVAQLEKQVADLQKPKTTRARSSSSGSSAARKRTTGSSTRKKPSG